jgi:NAD(P) transhydrogenase subunit alpha
MRIFVPKETNPAESRISVLPGGAAKLVKLGAEVEVEQGLGTALNCADRDYESAGARISKDRLRSLAEADMLLRLQKPPLDEVGTLRKGCIHASFLNPFNERELVMRLAEAEIPSIPSCYALMDTREEALAELVQVFNMIAETYGERGIPLPADTTEIVNA